MRTQRTLSAGLGQPQGLDIVALGQPLPAGIEAHMSAHTAQSCGRGHQLPTDGVAVAAVQQWEHDLVDVVHQRVTGIPPTEPLVGVGERLAHRPQGVDVALADGSAGSFLEHLIVPVEQPLADRFGERRRDPRRRQENRASLHVRPPQLADHRHGSRCAGGPHQTQVNRDGFAAAGRGARGRGADRSLVFDVWPEPFQCPAGGQCLVQAPGECEAGEPLTLLDLADQGAAVMGLLAEPGLGKLAHRSPVP